MSLFIEGLPHFHGFSNYNLSQKVNKPFIGSRIKAVEMSKLFKDNRVQKINTFSLSSDVVCIRNLCKISM